MNPNLKTDARGNIIKNLTGQDYKFTPTGDIDYSQSGSNFKAPQPPNAAAQPSSTPPSGVTVSANGAWTGMPNDPYKTPTPTASDIYGMDETEMSGMSYAKQQSNQAIPTEADAYSEKLKMHQAEIDAVNRIYADKLAEASRAGLNRAGSASARQARSGLLGSDFGASQDSETARYNSEITGSIQNEQAAAIQAILGKARTDAASEIAEKRAAKEKGYAAYTSYLTQFETRKKEKVSNLAKSLVARGVDIKGMSQKEMDELARSYGVSREDIQASYGSEKLSYDKAQSEIAKNQGSEAAGFTLQPGEFRYDANGKLVASGGVKDDILSVEEAKKLGVPYGTKKAEAYGKTVPTNLLGDLSSAEATIFNNIVDKYNKSPLVAAADRTVVLKGTIDKIRQNPGDGAQQLNLVYSYIQALDTYQSAVREGELGLVNSIDSKLGKFKNSIDQIQNGQIVRPEVALQIADAAKDVIDTIERGAKNKQNQYRSQASSLGLGETWDKYTGGFQGQEPADSGGGGVTTEEKATIDRMRLDNLPDSVIEQVLGKKISFNQVGGDTNLASAKAKIAKIESGGSYAAVSPVNRNGQRAYGKYQVLESNIPEWGKEALGRPVTVQEFRNDPKIQEAVADHQMRKIYSKYGNWDDVASVWFSGRPLAGNNSRDVTGTSVPQYVRNFNEA